MIGKGAEADHPPNLLAASCLKQEPDPALGLIDLVLEQTCGGDVACVIADSVDRAHSPNQGFLIFAKLTQHVGGIDEIGIVIRDALQAGNVTDRTDGRSLYIH